LLDSHLKKLDAPYEAALSITKQNVQKMHPAIYTMKILLEFNLISKACNNYIEII
jgi:hypothetical protein